MNNTGYIVALIALLFLFAKRKTAGGGSSVKNVDPASALRRVFDTFGRDIAAKVERIYRLETADFTSDQYRRTNTAGMRAFGEAYPFGWSSLASFGLGADRFAPCVLMRENAGGPVVPWVAFVEGTDAFMFLAYFLSKHGGNVGRWNSTDPAQQIAYAALVNAKGSPIVDAF